MRDAAAKSGAHQSLFLNRFSEKQKILRATPPEFETNLIGISLSTVGKAAVFFYNR